MEGFLSTDASLASLFVAAFVAATLIPVSSELALFGVLKIHPDLLWPALLVATAGNTLGGMSSYLIGRFLGWKKPLTQLERVRQWGAPALVFAWLPFVGDALCVAAGWLRLHWLAVMLYQAAGRFIRYWIVSLALV